MSDEPKVQITSAPGTKGQFGKGRLSYQNTAKVSTHVTVGSGVALAVAVSAVVLSGSPSEDQANKTSYFLGVVVPQTASTSTTLNIPRADSQPVVKPSPIGNGARSKSPIRFPGPQVVGRPRNVSIPPGSMVSAVLVSGASDGPVKAELQEPLIVAGETLLEARTMLVGTGNSGNERLMIRFRKAVFQDGSAANISAEAADADDKIAGLKGSRVGYRAVKLAAGIGLNFLGGMSQGLQDVQGQQGAVVAPPTMKNALMNGAAKASIEESQDLMNEYRNEKPVIEVGAGTPIYVLFEDSGSI
jgi:hypothetical protein